MVSKIRIIENESNNLIAEYPIELVDDIDEEDYFDEAWDNAVDDGLVDESCRPDYDFKIVDEQNLQDLTEPPNDDPAPNP